MIKKHLLVITALWLCLPMVLLAKEKFIQLKGDRIMDSEYSCIICFRFNEIDKSMLNMKLSYLNKNRDDINFLYALNYFDGTKKVEAPFITKGFKKDKITYISDVIYFAVKPGKYDLIGLSFSINNGNNIATYTYPVNAVISLSAGKAYYAGEVIINEDENQRYTWNLFSNTAINDSTVRHFTNNYPNIYGIYKKDFVSATFTSPMPVQPSRVVFSSHFSKNEGIWNEINDSLQTASFENGQYCIESKSYNNMGTEIIELPEKLGNTFDIELRCTWKSGTNAAYGFILPCKKAPLGPKLELEPRGYSFGISANGYAGIWFEDVPLMLSKIKKSIILTDWKNLPVIKTKGSGPNTIRLQVIDRVISFYVNDVFVVRAPYNSEVIGDRTGFFYTNSNLLGIFSFNKQKIEFDELRVSKFK